MLMLHSVCPDVNVTPPRFEDMFGHLLQPLWPIDIQFFATHHPRRENQIRITRRMVRMQVSQEGDADSCRLQGLQALLRRRRGPPDHARPEIDEIRAIAGDYS